MMYGCRLSEENSQSILKIWLAFGEDMTEALQTVCIHTGTWHWPLADQQLLTSTYSILCRLDYDVQ
jgi:hypothetical protein